MTELERKATQYAENKTSKGNYDYDVGDNAYFNESALKLAYIAGAKENGVVWHNIKENPDDLPKTPKEADGWKLVLGNDGNQWFYSETLKKWYTRNSYDNDWGSGCKALVAWAEIPTFEV